MLGWIVLAIVVVVALLAIGAYNRLVRLNQEANQAFADIDVQLKQRHDLIPNLVETVKGYATHERETLERVIQARNQAVQAHGVHDQAQAENMLTGALRQLFALSESYPELKANENFLSLQSELADVENKLAAVRRFFNNAVAEFNAAAQQFPAVLFAGMFGFRQREFFDVGESERAVLDVAPKVAF
jgi:LemA protein